jgi:hypothetical protein
MHLAQALPASDLSSSLSALDASILQLQDLRIRLVSGSPIHNLPAELLLSILSRSAGRHAHARLNELALVCKSWSSLLFTASALWSRPSFEDVRATTALLARSADAPLSVHIDLRDGSKHGIEASSLAIQEFGRTQHLDVVAPPNALGALFSALPRLQLHHAPTLETLRLSNHSVAPAHLALSHVSAPLLRSLTLSDFDISLSLSCPLLASAHRLVALDISRSLAQLEGRAELHDLLAVLDKMPELQYLTLRNCLPTPDPARIADATRGLPTDVKDENKTILPHLVHLQLEDEQAHIGTLISSLIVPAPCTLRLLALSDPVDDESFETLSSALGSHLNVLAGASNGMNAPSTLKAQLDGRSLRLKFSTLPCTETVRCPVLDISLIWRSPTDSATESRPASILGAVLSALPLDTIDSLTIADIPTAPPTWSLTPMSTWSTLLRRMPNTRLLRAEADSLAGLFEALSPSLDPTEVQRPLLAPALRTLTLARASFTDATILHAFVEYVRHWRGARVAYLTSLSTVGAAEPNWTTGDSESVRTTGAAQYVDEKPKWHRDLEAIDLDRCGFVSEDQIAQLKDAGMILAGF